MKIIIAIVFFCSSFVLQGLNLLYLWLWFVVPIFGIPELPLINSIAIVGLIGCLVLQLQTPSKLLFQAENKPDDEEERNCCGVTEYELHRGKMALMYAFVSPTFTLSLGYILHHFV